MIIRNKITANKIFFRFKLEPFNLEIKKIAET